MSRIIFFDLDDTLYAHNNGLWDAIAERMDRFLREIMDFSPEEASSLRQKYYQTYGTTLRGLQIHHQLDPLKYLHYVHDLPLHRYLKPGYCSCWRLPIVSTASSMWKRWIIIVNRKLKPTNAR